MLGQAFEWVTRDVQTALAFVLLLSGCLGDDSACLTDFCVTETEAIRQVDWIAVRLLERHPDGVAPSGLEDALGMHLPPLLPAGGNLTPSDEGSATSFDLMLPNGQVVHLFYNSRAGEPDRAAMVLHLSFPSLAPLNWCSWSNIDPAWACLRRF